MRAQLRGTWQHQKPRSRSGGAIVLYEMGDYGRTVTKRLTKRANQSLLCSDPSTWLEAHLLKSM